MMCRAPLSSAHTAQVLYANLLARTKAAEVAPPPERSTQLSLPSAQATVKTGGESDTDSKAGRGITVAGVEAAGPLNSCQQQQQQQPSQHSVQAREGDVPDTADLGIERAATASAAPAGRKRKHDEA